jgi:hypothetical protein
MADTVTAKGINVVVSFDGRMITIERRTPTRTKEKRIPVSSVTGVQWKPLRFGKGHLEFSVPGDDDDLEVSFVKKSVGDFEQLRDAVDAAIAER